MRKLNEKPHITRLGGQWVVEYQRADDSTSPPHMPLRVRRLTCGRTLTKACRKARSLVSQIGHYHRKIVARKPRKH
jgi:hypothetical protein